MHGLLILKLGNIRPILIYLRNIFTLVTWKTYKFTAKEQTEEFMNQILATQKKWGFINMTKLKIKMTLNLKIKFITIMAYQDM